MTEETTIVVAPFSEEQVLCLNAYQQSGMMHPFTCGGLHDGQSPVLTATVDGWVCPTERCAYRQDWAHDFMATRPRMELRGITALYAHVLFSTPRQSHAPV